MGRNLEHFWKHSSPRTPEPGLVAGQGTMLGQSLTVARNSNFVKYFVMTVSSAPRSGDCQNSEHLYSLLTPPPLPLPRPCQYDVLTLLLLLETEN